MSVDAKALLVAVARLAITQNRAISAAARSAGVNPTAWAILSELSLDGWLTNGQIAERLRMSTGGVTPALDRLAALGLLERRPNPADRRSSIVTITDAGHAHLDRCSDLLAQSLAAHLDGMEIEGRQSTLRFLVEANDAYGEVQRELEADAV